MVPKVVLVFSCLLVLLLDWVHEFLTGTTASHAALGVDVERAPVSSDASVSEVGFAGVVAVYFEHGLVLVDWSVALLLQQLVVLLQDLGQELLARVWGHRTSRTHLLVHDEPYFVKFAYEIVDLCVVHLSLLALLIED